MDFRSSFYRFGYEAAGRLERIQDDPRGSQLKRPHCLGNCTRLLRRTLHMMQWLAVKCSRFRILELLDVLGRELRAVHLDRQLVKLAGKGERRLVVGVVHAGQRVGADVEALVPLQDHRQRVRHGNGLDSFAVHLERAGAAAAEAAQVVERERADAEAVVLEVELDRVLAGRERVRAFPLDAFQVNQVPEEHRFALEQIEAVAGKPAARGQDHALGTALRHFNVRRDGV